MHLGVPSQVEVNGVWGYVCDDDFGFDEADVVCRDLGYDVAETFTRNNHFGENSAGLLIIELLDCCGTFWLMCCVQYGLVV